MSQSILEKVTKAIHNSFYSENEDSRECSFCIEAAKAAIGALRDLPKETFDKLYDELLWNKIIDKIGKDIALNK